MDNLDMLRRECEKIMVDGLPANLKASLERMHRRGMPKAAILHMVRAACVKLGSHPTCYTALGCEAYLDQLAPPERGGCCGDA